MNGREVMRGDVEREWLGNGLRKCLGRQASAYQQKSGRSQECLGGESHEVGGRRIGDDACPGLDASGAGTIPNLLKLLGLP